jgi:hypothetical protein
MKLSTKVSYTANSIQLEEGKLDNIRLFVRHGVVVESCCFESMLCGCSKKALSLRAQVFVNGRILMLLRAH